MVYVYLRSLFVYLAIDNVKADFYGQNLLCKTNRTICLVALAFFVYSLVMAVRRGERTVTMAIKENSGMAFNTIIARLCCK